jgi:hypothetical protein
MPKWIALALAAALCACAGPKLPDIPLADRPCLDNEVGRAYIRSYLRALYDAWNVPRGIPADETVEVALVFDEDGLPSGGAVMDASDERLGESVVDALTRAELPEPPAELRECLKLLRLGGTFRNSDTR